MTRHAFTLIELLVVLAIIVALAGLSLPAIAMVKRQARDAQCRSNLQGLFRCVNGYRLEHQQQFPASLVAAMSDAGDQGRKVLICPHDASTGTDPVFGRNPDWGPISLPTGTSYLFEVAAQPLNSAERDWDFDDPNLGAWGDKGSTWAEVKLWQLRHGGPGGMAYAENAFPIIRCFHHHTWQGVTYADRTAKVLNLAWDGSIFWSIPKWERQ